MKLFNPRLPAFSLLELLLTISIIATLLTFILPAINAARENARTTQCQTNLKQIHLALNSYAHDNRDYIPTPDAGLSWVAAIGYQGYLGEPLPKTPLITKDASNISNVRWLAFKCPSETTRPIATSDPDYTGVSTTCWDNDYLPTSYAMNVTLTPRSRSGSYFYGQPRAGWTAIAPGIHPSEARFLADSKHWSWGWDMPYYSSAIDTFPDDRRAYFDQNFHAFRHNGAQHLSNFAYMDGHADAREHIAYSGQSNFQILYPASAK